MIDKTRAARLWKLAAKRYYSNYNDLVDWLAYDDKREIERMEKVRRKLTTISIICIILAILCTIALVYGVRI